MSNFDVKKHIHHEIKGITYGFLKKAEEPSYRKFGRSVHLQLKSMLSLFKGIVFKYIENINTTISYHSKKMFLRVKMVCRKNLYASLNP